MYKKASKGNLKHFAIIKGFERQQKVFIVLFVASAFWLWAITFIKFKTCASSQCCLIRYDLRKAHPFFCVCKSVCKSVCVRVVGIQGKLLKFRLHLLLLSLHSFLWHSLNECHSHTHTQTRTLTLSFFLYFFLSLSHTHTHAHTLSLSLTHTHTS